ncbi:MAG: DUF922 domain-containing protein [Parvularcula sp.]
MAGFVIGLTALAAAAHSAPVGGEICSPDMGKAGIRSAVEVSTYPVAGRSVGAVVEALTSREKPYPSRAYGQVGWFDYSWTSRVSTNAAGQVSSACVTVQYKIHYPEMTDPGMQRCFSGLVQKVAAHERRHLDITDAVIRERLDKIVGLPASKAKKELARLDIEINRANEKFHHRREGRTMGPEYFPNEGCGQLDSARI